MVGATDICAPFKVRMGQLLYSLLYGVMTVIEDFCHSYRHLSFPSSKMLDDDC